jgi:hypothetical protein
MTATRPVGLEEGGGADGFGNGSNRTPSSSKDAHIMRNCSSIRRYTLADERVLIPVTLPHTQFLYQCSREGLDAFTPPHFSCGKLDPKRVRAYTFSRCHNVLPRRLSWSASHCTT